LLSYPQPTSTLKHKVDAMVGGCDLAIGTFTFEAIQREFGPRGDIVVGKRVGYLRMREDRVAIFAGQSPTSHQLNFPKFN
jgi:hypothetical protein